MFGQGFNSGFFGGPPCFTDTTDIFKDNSGVALYTLDYDASSGKDITTNTLQILGDTSCFAAYPLDGSSADLSGNYNGTDTSVTYTSGYFDQSASFDGSSSFITLPGSMLNSRTAISASAWVYRRTGSSDAYEYVIAGGDNVSGGRYGIAVNDAGSGSTDNKFYLSDGAASYHTNTVCAYNTWYHVALTWAGTEMKFYVNGSLDSTFTAASCNFQSSGNGHKIGEYFYNGTYEWEGEIDQVRLFNKAISASEVTILYNEIGCRDGTPTNVDFGVGGKSLYGARFNGSSSKITIPTSATTPIDFTSENFSISLWFKADSLHSGALIGKWSTSDGNGRALLLHTNSNGTFTFSERQGTSPFNLTTTSTYTADTWNHFVYVRNATQSILYLNTVSETDSRANTINSGSTTELAIGYQTGGFKYFDGSIDQVRVFNKALSSAEVGKLYGNGAGEIACTYTSTTNNVAYPIGNTAYYKLDNNSKDSAESTGKFGEGAVFNGSNSAIIVPNNILASNNHSVSMWFYLDDTTGTQTLIEFDYGNRIIFRVASTDSNWAYIGSSGYFNHGISFSAGQWYHLAITFSAGSPFKIYVNGNLSYTGGNTNLYLRTADNIIGAGNSSGANCVDGAIDQVRLFNKELSPAEVTTLYNETKNTTNTLQILGDSSCIATYQLDGNSTDLSGNYNGTDTNITYAYDGTESNVEYRFGRFGQAAVFNGSSKIDIDNVIPTDLNASLSMWVKSSEMNLNNTTVKTIFYNRNPYFIIYRYAGNWLFVIKNSSSTNYTVSCPVSNFNNNQWYHFAATCDGLSGTMNFYVNGISVGTTSSPSSILNVAASAFIGSGANAQYFNGSIDQIRVYSTALTSSQVTELYNEKPEVDTSNFKTVLYTGNGGTQYISNVGFEPGFVWVKNINSTNYHILQDSVRGAGKSLFSNGTQASSGNANDLISSFDFNGFTVNRNYNGTTSNPSTNENGATNVAWVWKGGGLLNKSASFNGSSSKIVLPNSSLGITDASNFSFSCWFNTNSSTQDNQGIFWTNGSNAGARFGVGINSTSQGGDTSVYFGVGTSSFTYINSGTSAFAANTWVHVVGVKSSTTGMSLYVDNVLKTTNTGATGAASSTATGDNRIGGYKTTAESSWFNGSIDQVRVFNKAISASEVTALYNETASTINTLQILGDTSCVAAYPLGVGAEDLSNTYSGTPSNVTFNNPGHLTRNNSGTIESTVSANTEAGFSIVKFTVPASGDFTAGHGLSSTPEMVITKSTDTFNWFIFHKDLSSGANGKYSLQFTTAAQNGSYKWWGDGMTSDVIGGTANTSFDPSTETIAYCWHSVAGYSSIGAYTGSGSATEKPISTGFEPSFVMIKKTSNTGAWFMHDNKRLGTHGYSDKYIQANLPAAEVDSSDNDLLEFTSTGFSLRTTFGDYNQLNGTYIYMAFK